MDETQKTYILDAEVAIAADSIEEAQRKAEAIISEVTGPSESLRAEGITGDEITFLGGSLAVAKEDKPVEFLRFGSDRPYQNSLALHPERDPSSVA